MLKLIKERTSTLFDLTSMNIMEWNCNIWQRNKNCWIVDQAFNPRQYWRSPYLFIKAPGYLGEQNQYSLQLQSFFLTIPMFILYVKLNVLRFCILANSLLGVQWRSSDNYLRCVQLFLGAFVEHKVFMKYMCCWFTKRRQGNEGYSKLTSVL